MSDIEIPDDVIAAARRVSEWMYEHGHKKWQLLDICDRNLAKDAMRMDYLEENLLTIHHGRVFCLNGKCGGSKSNVEGLLKNPAPGLPGPYFKIRHPSIRDALDAAMVERS